MFRWCSVLWLVIKNLSSSSSKVRNDLNASTTEDAEIADKDRLCASIDRNTCPDCKSVGTFLQGPCGGMSMNIMCAECGSKFNWCAGFFAERI